MIQNCKTVLSFIKWQSYLSHGIMQYSDKEWTPNTCMVYFNPLKTKCRPLYLKPQYAPRSKHFSSWL